MYSIMAYLKMEMIKQNISNVTIAKKMHVSPSLISRYFNQERHPLHHDAFCHALGLDYNLVKSKDPYFEQLIQKYIHSYYYQEDTTYTMYQRICSYESKYKKHPYALWLTLIKAIQKNDHEALLSIQPIYHLLSPYLKQVFDVFYLRYLDFHKKEALDTNITFKDKQLESHYYFYLFSYQTNNQNYHQAYHTYQKAKEGLTSTHNTALLETLDIEFGYFLSCLGFYEESNLHLSKMNISTKNINFAYYTIGWNYLFQKNYIQALQAFKRIDVSIRNKQIYFLLSYIALHINNKPLLTTYIQLSQNLLDQPPYTNQLMQWIIANKKIKHSKTSLQRLEHTYKKHKHEMKPLIKRLIQYELLSYYLESNDYQNATKCLLEINALPR